MKSSRWYALSGCLVGFSLLAQAAPSVQPYIDELKKEMAPSERPPGSFIDSVREKLPAASSAAKESYIDQIKAGWSEEEKNGGRSRGSLLEREKTRLSSENAKTGGTTGAIDKFKAGKSELEMRRPGDIGNAMGFRVGATLSRDIRALNGAGMAEYSDIYGSDRIPEIGLFYEVQPFHSEWFGSLGLFGSAALGFDSGTGNFQHRPRNAITGELFSAESRTRFYFFYVPVVAGVNYRFNLFRIARPFVMAGPALLPYWETRNDSKSGVKGYSRGLYLSAGVSILMDWMSRQSSWDLYDAYGVKHYYLTIDYSRLTTLAGDVRFGVEGFSAGMTFEF